MKNKIRNIKKARVQKNLQLSVLLVYFAFFVHSSFAQQTVGTSKTEISSQASATYSDGTNDYLTVSSNEILLPIYSNFFVHSFFAQRTAGANKTEISNQASAVYSDGTNAYSTISNNKNLLLIYSRRSPFQAKEKINIYKLNNPTRFFATDYSSALQNQ